MDRNLKKSAIAIALTAALNPAFANDDVPTPALALAASGENPNQNAYAETTVTQVTVSARRRTEKEQDVPSPITAIKGDDLKAMLISQVQDLQQALPSTNAAFMHARVSSVAIRGIGSNPANEGLEGSVGLYVDNVYQGRPGMLAIDLVDLEQVDLLRGPQGTLFGKNSTAGVLNLTTKRPTFTPERSIEVSAGERGYNQTLASVSGALSDHWAGRLSVSKTHDRGWLHNNYDGKDYNSVGREGIRGQLLYKPSDKFDLRLIADYNHEDDTQGTLIPYGFGPAAPGKSSWQAATAAALGLPAGSTPLITDPTLYQTSFDTAQRAVVYQGGLSAEANWRLDSGYSLTSITASRFWIFHPHNDNDVTAAPSLLDGGYNVKHRQFSQEVRLASPVGKTFDYVVGAYYYHQNIDGSFFINLGSKADIALLNSTAGLGIVDNTNSVSHGHGTTDSYALFSQGNWHLSEQWEFTGGLRATYEDKDGRSARSALSGGIPLTAYPAALRAIVQATRNAIGSAYDSGDLSVSGTAPSGLATLSYKVRPGLLGYVTASHGEKSGGINISGVGSAPTLGADSLKIRPEKANNFELGFKSQWLNNRLIVNADYYQTRIQDYQTNAYVTGPVTPVLILTNAGDVKSNGVEWDIKARPIAGLSLNFTGSYNDAHYLSFVNAPVSAELAATGATKADLSGQPLVGAPKWIANPGVRYDWRLNDEVRQYVVANYAWRSDAQGYVDNSKYALIPAYGLLNLSTGVQIGHGNQNWDISLWAKNALDKHYFLTASAAQTTGGGGYVAAVGAPRTIGVTARLEF
ncbi:TonB-dependent receptor [Duganella sp. FT80W]|uniref:TonB-dependent receptor n=1 Tax=Duganella guangzhouensis TaxID=2666084 RepID=A0A6I2L840_9BURK|nr:TonB-dependent receptor [Duganella guangzhouensis]MRW92449.1 TonB-dependent receptor [Duganella guangzhouensis]